MFKCDFNDLFTQISLQFIAIEVIRNKCTRGNTITELKEENHEKMLKTLRKHNDHLENVFKTQRSLSQFETPWKLFLCNTRQEIVFFSELGKSCWSQNICLHENIAFSTKITIGNKLRKYPCTSISMTSYHRINRMNEETKTTFRSVGSWSNGAFYRNKVGLCSIVLKLTT